MTIKEFKEKWMVSIMDSEIQRNLVWTKDFKEKLFESVLSGKPIGAITIFQENDKKFKEIIDGKQRIYALEAFWKGEISYKGKYINDYDINKFWNYELIIQEASGTFDDKVQLFNKINTCMIPLSPFELLRAKYYGDFVLGLSDYVGQDSKVRKVLDTNTRGKNEMIVLDIIRDKYSIDDFLKLNKDKDFNNFIKQPKAIFLFIADIFNSYKEIKVLIELAKTYKLHKTELMENRDSINDDIRKMLKAPHLEGWDKLSEFERILDRYIIKKDPKRTFSKEFRKELWESQAKKGKVICALCGQVIDTFEECEVDHIKPWSKGGTNIDSNGQLVHKYCNIIKSNK